MAGSTLAAHYVRAAEVVGLRAIGIESDSVVLGHTCAGDAAGLLKLESDPIDVDIA